MSGFESFTTYKNMNIVRKYSLQKETNIKIKRYFIHICYLKHFLTEYANIKYLAL